MEPYVRPIFVADTDFTGGIYFTKIQDIALEAFIQKVGMISPEKQSPLLHGPLLFPVVHAEASYQSPVSAGDTLQVKISLCRVGRSSFTYKANLNKGKVSVATVSITHVCIKRENGQKVEVPSWLKE